MQVYPDMAYNHFILRYAYDVLDISVEPTIQSIKNILRKTGSGKYLASLISISGVRENTPVPEGVSVCMKGPEKIIP